ncbi:lipoprotein insertase outer membrane protein LolB [Lacimicrobium sp. SS2-24]|uniref:lipoprotein insertase outer membrane protein LolB n=1 Tax=Lacimicrobium sp. SS2-24 TaxID=2005569 RepID=UPI001438AE9F|nr:lipoprotein insertase outer membrane protein LolB [Lacimicrobium sp. SS2-24]
MLTANPYRLTIIGVLLLLLFGCATRPPTYQPVNAVQHQASLKKLKNWHVRGKLAFRSEQDKFSANLNWQQQNQQFNVNLSSFLGTNILVLEKHDNRVELQYDDEHYYHTNAGELLYDLLGWTIPVESISQWVKGQASPNAQLEFSDDGLISTLKTRDGWVVRYSDYRATDGILLPHDIRLNTGSNSIKIRVDAWRLN